MNILKKSDFYKGSMGKTVYIDLSKEVFEILPLDKVISRRYFGGRGIGIAYLFEHFLKLKKKYENPFLQIDPLSEDNALIISTSPATGTKMPASSRIHLNFKSPLTRGIGSSNAGGSFGLALKKAGYDLLYIAGKAKKPVYIIVYSGKVEFHNAGSLYDLDSIETRAVIKKNHPKTTQVMTIGGAGKKMVRFASAMVDKGRAFGRGGAGAVLGSKNLFAVGVAPDPNIKISVANPESLKISNKEGTAYKAKMKLDLGKLTRKEAQYGTLSSMGTSGLMGMVNYHHQLIHKNMKDTKHCIEDIAKIDGEALRAGPMNHEYVEIKKDACFNCPVACKRKNKIIDKNMKIVDQGHGPEFETMAMNGANLDVYDPLIIIKTSNLLNRYGIDTISFGSAIAAFFELYEYVVNKKKEGSLTDKERLLLEDVKDFVDKYRAPGFSVGKCLIPLVHAVGTREGIGEYLALGSYRFCDRYGHKEFSMTVKKMELPAYDPRGSFSQGLCYEMANRGGCHLQAGYLAAKAYCAGYAEWPGNRIEGTALIAKNAALTNTVADVIGACAFTSFSITLDEYAGLVTAVTGTRFTVKELQAIAKRTLDKEREFNMLCGFTKNDDRLPKRFFTEYIEVDNEKRICVKKDFQKMRNEYYKAMGWD